MHESVQVKAYYYHLTIPKHSDFLLWQSPMQIEYLQQIEYGHNVMRRHPDLMC